MPIYEFSCEKCGKDSEVLVRSAKWEGTPCPHCGSTRLAKKLSVFASTAGSGVRSNFAGVGRISANVATSPKLSAAASRAVRAGILGASKSRAVAASDACSRRR